LNQYPYGETLKSVTRCITTAVTQDGKFGRCLMTVYSVEKKRTRHFLRLFA